MKQLNMIDTDPNHAIMDAVSAGTTVILLMKYSGSDTMKIVICDGEINDGAKATLWRQTCIII